MNKKSVFNVLRVVISVGLLALLIWLMRNSFGEVMLALRKSNKLLIFLSFLLFLVGMILLSIRLRLIIKAQDLIVTQSEATSLIFVGQFFNNFLPTSVGGDIVKIYYIAKKTGKKLSSFAAVFFDRLLGTFTLVITVLLTYIFVKEAAANKSIMTFMVIAVSVAIPVCLILFSRRIAKKIPFLGRLLRLFKLEDKMKEIYEIIYTYKKHPRLLVNAILISFALQVVTFYAVYFMARGLNCYVPLKMIFLFMPIISTVSMAPSINGLGVREGSFVLLFGPLMGKEAAFALSILWLAINFCASLIGGVLYLFGKQFRFKGGVAIND